MGTPSPQNLSEYVDRSGTGDTTAELNERSSKRCPVCGSVPSTLANPCVVDKCPNREINE